MAVNWKAAAAGGAIAGLGIGGVTFANASDSSPGPVGGVDVGNPSATAPATAPVVPAAPIAVAPGSVDRSTASSIRSVTEPRKKGETRTIKKSVRADVSASARSANSPRSPRSPRSANSPRSVASPNSPASPASPASVNSPASADSPDGSS